MSNHSSNIFSSKTNNCSTGLSKQYGRDSKSCGFLKKKKKNQYAEQRNQFCLDSEDLCENLQRNLPSKRFKSQGSTAPESLNFDLWRIFGSGDISIFGP